MKFLEQDRAVPHRLVALLLAIICLMGLLPTAAFAAGSDVPDSIIMEGLHS